MSLFSLLQQCPVCLAYLSWKICKMGGKWLYSSSFFKCCFQDLFKELSWLIVIIKAFVKAADNVRKVLCKAQECVFFWGGVSMNQRIVLSFQHYIKRFIYQKITTECLRIQGEIQYLRSYFLVWPRLQMIHMESSLRHKIQLFWIAKCLGFLSKNTSQNYRSLT